MHKCGGPNGNWLSCKRHFVGQQECLRLHCNVGFTITASPLLQDSSLCCAYIFVFLTYTPVFVFGQTPNIVQSANKKSAMWHFLPCRFIFWKVLPSTVQKYPLLFLFKLYYIISSLRHSCLTFGLEFHMYTCMHAFARLSAVAAAAW